MTIIRSYNCSRSLWFTNTISKPEAATAVELLMMGMRMPEIC
jgi:hypothetical protein